uniref:Uncharacterized protein n=1 Tax=Anguilla anguilla TaxID=7936 RepID=A0A0E9QQJ4_ANGAN
MPENSQTTKKKKLHWQQIFFFTTRGFQTGFLKLALQQWQILGENSRQLYCN